MKKVTKLKAVPAKSTIENGFESIHYFDTYQIRQKTNRSAEEISKKLMKMPGWVDLLFKIRNSIVGVFGLKTEMRDPEKESFFSIIENREEEIVMGESDKHLNFWASILKDNTENTIALTTIVHFNNIWGRVYFFPVKPFHKIIMREMLKRYLNDK